MPRVCCRSSALTFATHYMMPTRTTSPRFRWPHSSAIVPPICPAPMSAIFLREAMSFSPFERGASRLHVLDDLVAELGALHLCRVGDALLLHEPREVVGDPVRGDGAVHPLDDEVRGLVSLRRLRPLPLLPRVDPRAELPLRERVAPVPERSLGELHDVALVDEGDALSLQADRVVDRRADEALRALARDRLHADAGRAGEPDLLELLRELPLEEGEDLLRLLGARLPLDAGVDVLGVLAEDHHVDLLRVLHRRRDALESADGAQAHVEVEELAERDVEGSDAAADRGRERALDADEVLAERLDRLV